MRTRVLWLIATVLIASLDSDVVLRAQSEADVRVFAVAYVEVSPSSKPAMIAALKQYRTSSSKDAGCEAIDAFEQAGWPGHFAIVERWKDQPSFDAHQASPHAKQYQDALQPLRVSGYDQRPYKTLSVAPARDRANAGAVHIVAHVDAAPNAQGGKIDAPALLRRLAEASRKEPGNLRFDVLQHAMRGNHFTVVETWQSQAALDAHAAAAHTKQYRDELQPFTGSPLDERLYKAVD